MNRILVLLLLWGFSAENMANEMDRKMTDRAYLSEYYKGFLLQQTDKGWIVVNLPSRTKFGPVSPGPFSTPGIAKHVIDRIIDDSNR